MQYVKLNTTEVSIGDLKMGGQYPIKVQSMITSDTMNTPAVVEECMRLIEAGCELIRITAPSIKEAENLAHIKAQLKQKGYNIPLCADIHYTPNAAETAARIVEKVRINPGNYADKKKFEYKEYSDSEYNAELERIREKFLPLIKICKEYGTALRIGTNHGSLSDRVLSKYGDTPIGMVESAMEFVRICEEENLKNIVISMKASNPLVMIEAYRLLVHTMIQSGTLYPLHLGVTEAGDGEDGRIKSAIGIGTLLEDGMGDTVRVSLTEPAENEIPAAKKLVETYNDFREKNLNFMQDWLLTDHPQWRINIENINTNKPRRQTKDILNISKDKVPVVIQAIKDNLPEQSNIKPSNFFSAGYIYNTKYDKWNITDFASDYIYIGQQEIDFDIPGNLGIIQDYMWWIKNKKEQHYPLINLEQLKEITEYHRELNFLEINSNELGELQKYDILTKQPFVLIINIQDDFYASGKLKYLLEKLYPCFDLPLIFKLSLNISDEETFIMHSSKIFGYLMTSGYGNGIMIVRSGTQKILSPQKLNHLMFDILQALRWRISKTEYIACPSCGRTLFDLQETTQKIKEKTAHLKGLKIGIMGCIVNGPGEMADADFGYVGTGYGKISLYKGHQVIKRNIPEEKAVEELINLIKEYGMYKEANHQIEND